MSSRHKELHEILNLRVASLPPLPAGDPGPVKKLFDKVRLAARLKITPSFHLTDIHLRGLEWLARSNLPIARDCLGLALSGNTIYAIGGRTDMGDHSLYQTEPTLVHAYDLQTGNWSDRKDMPYPHVGHATVTAPDGPIYACGGYIKITQDNWNDPQYKVFAAQGSMSSMVQEYNPASDSWTVKTPMAHNRVFAAAAVSTGGKLHVFGGYHYKPLWPDPANPDQGNYSILKLAAAERYDIMQDSWSPIAPMPTARSGLAAVLGKDGLIYVMGGLGENCEWLPTVEAYNPATDTWSTKADMPRGRGAFAAVVDSVGRIYAIGGVCSWDSIGEMDVYDPATNTWSSGPSLPIDRLSHGAVITGEDVIYVAGGSMHHHEEDKAELLASVLSHAI